MAKIVRVVYKVDSKELEATKKSLEANTVQAKKFDDSLKKVGTTAKDVGKDAGKSFLDFKNMLATVSFVGIIAGLTSLGKKIFDLGVQQEQLNIAFTTFLGSAEKAKKLLAELTKFAIVTPFSPDQVNKAAKTLLAFGTQAKDIIPTLKMIGDVSAGTGKDLAEMAVIFGQIKSTGRLMGQDLLQLINAGFNPLQIISEKTGVSVGKLKEQMEKGLISFAMVEGAFKSATSAGGLFFNLMEKQSVSVGGKLSTVAGNIDEIGKNLFRQSSGNLKAAVDILVIISEKLMEISKPLEERFQDALNKFGEGSEEFAEVAKEALFQFGEERLAQMTVIAKAEKSLSFASIENQEEANRLLTEFIRLKEEHLASKMSRINQSDEDIAQIRLLQEQIKIGKEKLAGIQADLAKAKALEPKQKKLDLTEPKDVFGGEDETFDQVEKRREREKTAQEDERDALKKFTEEKLKIFMDGLDAELEAGKTHSDEVTKEESDKQHKIREIKQEAFDFTVGLLGMLLISSMQANREEMAAIDEKYSRELELAGNNEAAKKSIEKRRDQEMKEARLRQQKDERDARLKTILAETLVNAVKALGLPPIPGANFIAAAKAVAYGAVQAGLVGKFKDGGWISGPGTPTSDSVPILASRDEFMVNAAAASQSPNLLEAINDRKINDSVLRGLATSGGRSVNVFDDSRLIKAIENNQVDFAAHGYTLMKVQQSGANFKRYIRSKIQGY